MDTLRALVVEDDPRVLEMIDEVMAALGHEYDVAHSPSEAMKFLRSGTHAYILSDIEIAASPGRATRRIQNTENLAEHIIADKGKKAPPMIVMSDRIAGTAQLTVEMMRLANSFYRKGVADFIEKPFPTEGRTLDRVIKKVLGLNGHGLPLGRPWKSRTGRRTPIPVARIGKADRPVATPEATPAATPTAPPPARAAGEALTLDEFMAAHCEKLSRDTRRARRRALLAASRNGTVELPSLAEPHRSGQPNRYVVHDLRQAWPGFLSEGVALPSLLPAAAPPTPPGPA